MCSVATGSRTIVSHGNDIADPDSKEFWDRFFLAPRMPEWIHIEGRNCSAVQDFLVKLDQVPWTGTVSVDFERPTEGLRDFIGIADVLFISETYATALTEGMRLADGDHESLFHAVIDNISQDVKHGASGHLLLGSVGSYSFCKTKDYDMKAQYLERLRTKDPKPLGTGSIGDIVYARFEPLQLKAGEVVESIGAGDTFIAGVIWAMVRRWSWIDANLLATMIAGQKCTGHGFKRLWTSDVVRRILERYAAQAGAEERTGDDKVR
jgi:sugar/nucleoside kinase (ribokinase family)